MEVLRLESTRLRQEDLLERFRENNQFESKVSLVKLLIKENLLGCFHYLATY